MYNNLSFFCLFYSLTWFNVDVTAFDFLEKWRLTVCKQKIANERAARLAFERVEFRDALCLCVCVCPGSIILCPFFLTLILLLLPSIIVSCSHFESTCIPRIFSNSFLPVVPKIVPHLIDHTWFHVCVCDSCTKLWQIDNKIPCWMCF